MFLAGDIGGTKTILALFQRSGDGVELVCDGTFPSHGHATFEEILRAFLAEQPGVQLVSACLGVAGPVVDGRCHTTNLPWVLDERVLAQVLGVPRVKLLNDLEATAFGMPFLRSDELCVLQPGASPRKRGNVAVIAAGTGLGEAMLYWDGRRYHPIASEGGHADFAPHDDREAELLKYVREQTGGHVSYERVLSGPGIHTIYLFLRDRGYYPEPPWLARTVEAGDANAVIAQLGLVGDQPLCSATIEMFCAIYGAEAGNIALRCVALGGVYVGGGIAPKLLPALQSGGFVRAFRDKGRLSDLLGSIEVSVALNERAALLGAAHYALVL
jgi:glucokinase